MKLTSAIMRRDGFASPFMLWERDRENGLALPAHHHVRFNDLASML